MNPTTLNEERSIIVPFSLETNKIKGIDGEVSVVIGCLFVTCVREAETGTSGIYSKEKYLQISNLGNRFSCSVVF